MTNWNLEGTRHHILICNGGSCMKKQGEEVTKAIRSEIKAQRADHIIHTSRTRCNGRCEDACVVIVYPEGDWYRHITPESGAEIVRSYLSRKEPLTDRLAYSFDPYMRPTGTASIGIEKRNAVPD